MCDSDLGKGKILHADSNVADALDLKIAFSWFHPYAQLWFGPDNYQDAQAAATCSSIWQRTE